MPPRSSPLPAEAVALLEQGQKIAAIKVVREVTGVGLKEAKDAVEAYSVGRPVSLVGARAFPAEGLPPAALVQLQEGKLIDAIRLTREATGLPLKRCKELVEKAARAHPSAQQRAPDEWKSDPGQRNAATHENRETPAWRLALILAIVIGAVYAAYRSL